MNREKNRTEGMKPRTVPNREILNRCSPIIITYLKETVDSDEFGNYHQFLTFYEINPK